MTRPLGLDPDHVRVPADDLESSGLDYESASPIRGIRRGQVVKGATCFGNTSLSCEEPYFCLGGDSTKTGAITSTAVGEKVYGKQFYIDQVPSKAPPIIWASRVGTPRIAIIGSIPTLKAPMLSTAFGNRLSISVPEPGRPATVYYRPANDFNTSLVIRPDMLELAAALGGEVAPGNVPMRLCYGDVLAVLKQICDGGLAVANGEPVPLILEDMVADLVDEAPNIPGLENM